MATAVSMTPAAAEKLLELQGGDPARAVLRLYVAGRSCCSYQYGLAFDGVSAPEDAVQELAGLRLAVGPDSVDACAGATIDFIDGPAGTGFAVRGPSLNDGCSCGRRQAAAH